MKHEETPSIETEGTTPESVQDAPAAEVPPVEPTDTDPLGVEGVGVAEVGSPEPSETSPARQYVPDGVFAPRPVTTPADGAELQEAATAPDPTAFTDAQQPGTEDVPAEAPLLSAPYPMNARRRAEIDQRFSYHPPRPDQAPRYTYIRARAHDMAIMLNEMCPQSRELSMALSHLDEMVMCANASIARNEKAEG